MELPSEGNEPVGSDDLDEIRRTLLELAASDDEFLANFARRMNDCGIAVPSAAQALHIARSYRYGSVSPYQLARLIDPSLTPAEANANRPTALALEIMDAMGADAFGYDEALRAPEFKFGGDEIL